MALSARIALIVSPGARRGEIVGRHGDGWKVRVTAAAERGRANDAALALLAESLGIERTSVRLVSGQTSRRKIVQVDGLDEKEAGRRLEAPARPARPS